MTTTSDSELHRNHMSRILLCLCDLSSFGDVFPSSLFNCLAQEPTILSFWYVESIRPIPLMSQSADEMTKSQLALTVRDLMVKRPHLRIVLRMGNVDFGNTFVGSFAHFGSSGPLVAESLRALLVLPSEGVYIDNNVRAFLGVDNAHVHDEMYSVINAVEPFAQICVNDGNLQQIIQGDVLKFF